MSFDCLNTCSVQPPAPSTMPLTEGTSPRGSRFSTIFARLSELPNYVWDADIKPFHSVSLLLRTQCPWPAAPS